MSLLGFIFRTIGELLIGYAILQVHNKVEQEVKIDSQVISKIRLEKQLSLMGIILIIIGFFLQLPSQL